VDLELHQLELKYKGMRILHAGQQSQLMSSLSEHGQHSPVLVVEAARDRFVLIVLPPVKERSTTTGLVIHSSGVRSELDARYWRSTPSTD
jgi:hypothetical protein